MNATTELSSLLRRSSQPTVDRVLFLLYALDTWLMEKDGVGAGGGKGASLSLPSLCLILRYAFPGCSPRLLFALAADGDLYRSPDRGVSWRAVFRPASRLCTGATPCQQPMADEDKQLQDIIQILPRNLPAAEPVGEADAEKKPSSSAACLACEGDTVVVGGRGGLLAVSLDRGVHFSMAPARLWDSFQKDVAVNASPDVTHVAVVGSSAVLVAVGKEVASVVTRAAGNTGLAFGTSRRILTCTGRVCSLTAVPATSVSSHVLACEAGVLHLSWDEGQSFLAIPHKLGFIRSVAPFTGVRRANMTIMQCTADFAQTGTSGGNYEYAVVLRKPTPQPCAAGDLEQHADALRRAGFAAHGAPEQEVFCHTYLAVGSGTEVLPYDYSCVLCVGVRLTRTDTIVVSYAANVRYTPFLRSTVAEPVPCVTSNLPGSASVVAVRGGESGVSFSSDGGVVWSPPQKSAPAALLSMDGGEVLLCSQRGTATAMAAASGATIKTTTISGDFRAPATVVAAAFL